MHFCFILLILSPNHKPILLSPNKCIAIKFTELTNITVYSFSTGRFTILQSNQQVSSQKREQRAEIMSGKPLLELYVKASGIDSRRIGACLFCQEFWMELYALYEVGCVRVEVKTVNVNSEGFKRNFSGAQPPIMVEEEKGTTYADNSEIERRIFHLCQEFNVPLFEKDLEVEKTIQNLYRNFKIFLQAKANFDKGKKQPSAIDEGLPPQVTASHNKVLEQLTGIDQLLSERRSQYLLGDTMTEYDCEVMPRLHHMRIIGERLLGFYIPRKLTHLWNYILTAYRTAAFIESCPADQDILHHYKEQLNLAIDTRVTLEAPTKTLAIPEDVLQDIRGLNNGTNN